MRRERVRERECERHRHAPPTLRRKRESESQMFSRLGDLCLAESLMQLCGALKELVPDINDQASSREHPTSSRCHVVIPICIIGEGIKQHQRTIWSTFRSPLLVQRGDTLITTRAQDKLKQCLSVHSHWDAGFCCKSRMTVYLKR